MCAVHAFRQYLRDVKRDGGSGRVFPRLNPTSFARVLRLHLSRAGFAHAAAATSHGFRRGTTQELLRRGGRLHEILASGDWKSSAFLAYLDRQEVDFMAFVDLMEEAEERPPPAPVAAPALKRARVGAPRAQSAQLGDIRVFFPGAA
jgi:hypothetical protein